jgi:hypothetical protein
MVILNNIISMTFDSLNSLRSDIYQLSLVKIHLTLPIYGCKFTSCLGFNIQLINYSLISSHNVNPKAMKILILSMLMLAMASISNAQNVNIPDAKFIYALISAGVDTNEDLEISYTEAEAITYLDVKWKEISDLTGIEAFVNLDTLFARETNYPFLILQ